MPGGPYIVHGMNDNQYHAIAARYCEFLPPRQRPSIPIKLEIISTAPSRTPLTNPPFRQATYLRDRVIIETNYFYGIIRLTPYLSARIFYHLPDSAHPSYFTHSVFHYFMRNLAAYSLLMNGGLLLHSSCVIIGGRAQLFLGPSGAGKSTIASLFKQRNYRILSDDLNCIEASGPERIVSPLPFSGDIEYHDPSYRPPFTGLFSLKKSQSVMITSVSASRVLPLIVANSPIINRDPYRLDLLLNNLFSLLRGNTALGQVHFPRHECPDEQLIHYLSGSR